MSKLSPEESERCNAALDEAKAILEKTFDSFVVIARFEDMDCRSAVLSTWNSDYSDAIGLTQIQLWRFQERERANLEADESDDTE